MGAHFIVQQGGSSIVMDLDRRTTVSYVMSKMAAGTVGNPRTVEYLNAIFDAAKSNAASEAS